jgi:pyruvate/2-oxoglutarate dehydrogenase complex dihydrolipoamide acyltransferase (E2) component
MSYPDQLAQDLLNQGLQTSEVRDEIYCQIIKQLEQNPNPSSKQKGWKLMEMCLQTFAPGDDFANYLEMYLRSHHGQDREKNKYVLMLHDTQYGPKRQTAPNVDSLERQNSYTPTITLDVQTEIDPTKVKVADLDAMKAALPPGVGGGLPAFPRPGGGPSPMAAAASPMAPPSAAASAPPPAARPAAAPPAPEPAAEPAVQRCTALYDYEAQDYRQLTIHAGDVITISDESPYEGWWMGTCNGQTGIFPSNYVEMLD